MTTACAEAVRCLREEEAEEHGENSGKTSRVDPVSTQLRALEQPKLTRNDLRDA